MANPFRIRSKRPPHYAASAHEVIAMLGLTSSKLPVDGMPQRDVQGIRVYVNPLPERAPTNFRGRRFAIRVMAICPACQRHLAASRLHQHRCKSPIAADIGLALETQFHYDIAKETK